MVGHDQCSVSLYIKLEGTFTGPCIQLFRQRLPKKSLKAYATMPKGSLGNTQ